MRLSPWETLGAWLRIWTPPREAEVPPVPWRKLVLGGVAAAVVLGIAAALIVPAVSEDKRSAGERDRRAAAERHAKLLATADREQRPRTGTGPVDTGVPARAALLARARTALVSDARARTGDDVTGTDCEPFPRRPGAADPAGQLRRKAAAYQCVAVTSRFEGGVIGIPFRLVVRFAEGTYAFCRIVPMGDQDRLAHPLPDACRL